eukprot:TRINITY_DN11724_c0_g1_i1.p1 TRINITY_DN11724_c0_g1~~TRINITY_DN11724_c0_g1_i1.p1  ORF type:complete len:488 (+),score=124.16 TRINITY_DN11724_c0_g1_i1:159-1622(+)
MSAGGFSPTKPNGIRLCTEIVLERPTEPLGTQCICEGGRVTVIKVLAGGAAERCGIQKGDIIRNLGGYEVESQEDMRRGRVVALSQNVTKISIEVLRLNRNISTSPERERIPSVPSPEKIIDQLTALTSALSCDAITKEEYDVAVLRINGYNLSPPPSPPKPSPPPKPPAETLKPAVKVTPEIPDAERDARSRRHPSKDRVVPPPDPNLLPPKPTQQPPPKPVEFVDPAEEAQMEEIINAPTDEEPANQQTDEVIESNNDIPDAVPVEEAAEVAEEGESSPTGDPVATEEEPPPSSMTNNTANDNSNANNDVSGADNQLNNNASPSPRRPVSGEQLSSIISSISRDSDDGQIEFDKFHEILIAADVSQELINLILLEAKQKAVDGKLEEQKLIELFNSMKEEAEEEAKPSADNPDPQNGYYTPETLARISKELTSLDPENTGLISEEQLATILNSDDSEESDILNELLQLTDGNGSIQYSKFFDSIK